MEAGPLRPVLNSARRLRQRLQPPLYSHTFAIGDNTYAIVASLNDNGVQLMDVTDPTNPIAIGSATDGVDGFTTLDGARKVDIVRP